MPFCQLCTTKNSLHTHEMNTVLSTAHSTAFHIKDDPYQILPHSAAIKFHSNKISRHNLKLPTQLPYRPSTAHSFSIQDRLYLPCSIATTLHYTTYTLSMHINIHYTHPAIPFPCTAFHNPAMHTTIKHKAYSWQNGTRCRDCANVLWYYSYLVWLVFEGSIPTCTCFHLENVFVT